MTAIAQAEERSQDEALNGTDTRRLLDSKQGAVPAAAAPTAAASGQQQQKQQQQQGNTRQAPEPAPELAPECRVLLQLAEPPELASPFDNAHAAVQAAVAQLERLQAATGLPVLKKDSRGVAHGISLTGWSALVGLAALVVAVAGGAALAWRRYYGPRQGYTLVTKSVAPQGQ